MTNTNPTTGIRYGVIAMNSLDPDLAHELMYGAGALDLSYKAAHEDAEREARQWATSFEDEVEEEAKIAAAELGDVCDLEAFIESRIESAWLAKGYNDADDYIECELEKFSVHYECGEPEVVGEYEGVTYEIKWLGGAPLVCVLHGPIGRAASLCSPCVPNAADLDSGFTEGTEEDGVYPPTGFECYVAPRDWLAKEAV